MSEEAFASLEAARSAVVAEGESFVRELEPPLRACLLAGVDRVTRVQAARFERLEAGVKAALRDASARGIEAGVRQVLDRLGDPEVWLAPFTAPDLVGRHEGGWSLLVPEWATRLGRRRDKDGPRLGALDDPGNRIWIAIASAATPLDPILVEFGFAPGRPRLGGGRFGVQPQTVARLDPSGSLQRRWKRYRGSYERMAELVGRGAP